MSSDSDCCCQNNVNIAIFVIKKWQDKKKKGKKGKKQDFDEDDLLDELAEIEAEMGGEKKAKRQDSEEKEEPAEKKVNWLKSNWCVKSGGKMLHFLANKFKPTKFLSSH